MSGCLDCMDLFLLQVFHICCLLVLVLLCPTCSTTHRLEGWLFMCTCMQAFKCVYMTIRNFAEGWVEFLPLFVKGYHLLRAASRHSLLSWRYNWTISFLPRGRGNSLREEEHSGLQQTSVNTCRGCRVGQVCIQLLLLVLRMLNIIWWEHKLFGSINISIVLATGVW